MSVNIEKISDNRYTVNGKLFYRNIDGNWVCPSNDLTPNEEKAVMSHIKAEMLNLQNRLN
ncbi:MAG: hypothetical protein GX159_09665 [Flavobacteriaceae bacterium]|jgi:hypothetical protein|nr:hypothetical protein [Flavobacteriaceae bacterium]